MIGAARAMGRGAIVSLGWAGLALADEAADDQSVGEVNHQALFPRVAAVVHHGGAGTTTATARAGTPQILIPQVYDQHYWAGSVDHLGIGIAHRPRVPTTTSLITVLRQALQPAVTARARAIAAAVQTARTPPPSRSPPPRSSGPWSASARFELENSSNHPTKQPNPTTAARSDQTLIACDERVHDHALCRCRGGRHI